MLTQVTFLEMFNVSYNNLSSPIPEGNQFRTLENNSYIGNPELCGSPLTKKGGKPLQPSPSPAHNQEQKLRLTLGVAWITAGIGLAGGLIVGVALEQAFGNDVLDWLARKWHKLSKKYSLR
ncbi:hypothetical protein MLD38_040900 [Melastoma candidum]|nr:hypothetical protein MLD38_040900 [Melastoma candidum]